MKLREMEHFLTQAEPFQSPKVNLEQYPTSAHIASRMVYSSLEHIDGSFVCDLGSGCGVLSMAAMIGGASWVTGFEIDPDAIEVCQRNFELVEDGQFELVQAEVGASEFWKRYEGIFDMVLMNPPFGTRATGADVEFLKFGTKLVRSGGRILSLHKTSTRPFFMKHCGSGELTGKVLAEVKFDLPKSYKFHKKAFVDVAVDFWEFVKS